MIRLPRPTGKQMLRFLERQGFILERVRGSHHFLRKDGSRTIVPVHGNKDLKTGTLRKILRDIHMTTENFKRLWKD